MTQLAAFTCQVELRCMAHPVSMCTWVGSCIASCISQAACPGPATRAGGEGEAPRRGRRIALSLHVARAAAGLGPEALAPGRALPACVRSVEDHGFTLTLGIPVRRCLRAGCPIPYLNA